MVYMEVAFGSQVEVKKAQPKEVMEEQSKAQNGMEQVLQLTFRVWLKNNFISLQHLGAASNQKRKATLDVSWFSGGIGKAQKAVCLGFFQINMQNVAYT